MADELRVDLGAGRTGLTVTAAVFNAETLAAVGGMLTCSEAASIPGLYFASMPAAAAGHYFVRFSWLGQTDSGDIFWDGAAEISPAALSAAIATRAAPGDSMAVTGDLSAAMIASVTAAATAATPTAAAVTGNIGGNVLGSVSSVSAAVTLPAIPVGWLTAAGIAAGALDNKGNWSTYAGSDTSGVTTLLGRLSATRAGYIDNLSGGAVATQASVNAIPTNPLTSLGANAPVGWLNSSAFTAGALNGLGNWSTLDAAGVRTAVGLSSASLDTTLSTLATQATALAVKTVTDKLATMLESAGAAWRWTVAALVQAPSGGSGGGDWLAKTKAEMLAYGQDTGGYAAAMLLPVTPNVPTVVLPAPPSDTNYCRVVGYFGGLSHVIPTGSIVLFELIHPDDPPLKSSRILVGRSITAVVDSLGNLSDGEHAWIDLERNDTLSTPNTLWRVTFADARMTRITFTLNETSFDLSQLVD